MSSNFFALFVTSWFCFVPAPDWSESKVKGEAFFSSGTFAAQKFSFRIIGDSKLTDVNVMGRLSVLALNALELDLIKTDRMKLGESSHHHGADDHQSMSVRDTETC